MSWGHSGWNQMYYCSTVLYYIILYYIILAKVFHGHQLHYFYFILKILAGKRSCMSWLPWRWPSCYWPFTAEGESSVSGTSLSVCWQPDRLTSPTPIKWQYTGNESSCWKESCLFPLSPTGSIVPARRSWFWRGAFCVTLSLIVLWCITPTV